MTTATVLAKRFPEESADRLAARIVGTAVQVLSLQGKCISGGIASLQNALSQKPVPVPQQAFCDGQGIQVRGHFFGDKAGTLMIGGSAARILAWSDSEIMAVAPTSFNGRECMVSIQSSDGKNGSRILDFNVTFGKLEAAVPDGMRELTHLRIASLVPFQGKLYAAGNNSFDIGYYQQESRLYCIDPNAGTCRRVALFPYMISGMCAAEDYLVLLKDQTMIFLSSEGEIQRKTDVLPYQPLMSAQAGGELVVLCTLGSDTKLCVFQGGRLEPLYSVGGICSDSVDLADASSDGNMAYFLYRNGAVLQVSDDLKMSIRQLSTDGKTALTMEVADGVPWIGSTNDNDVLVLCPAENWTLNLSKGFYPSSEMFLLPRSAVLGEYLYLIGLTPSLESTLILRRVRICDGNPDTVQMPQTGDGAGLLFLQCCWLQRWDWRSGSEDAVCPRKWSPAIIDI